MTGQNLDAEQKLKSLFASQAPMVPDYSFDIAVMERIAKRRAVVRFTQMAMSIFVAGGMAAAGVLAIQEGQSGALVPMLAAISGCAIAGLVIWTLGRARTV